MVGVVEAREATRDWFEIFWPNWLGMHGNELGLWRRRRVGR